MQVPFLKWILTLSDFSLLFYLLSLMLDHVRNNYSLKSWSSIFHIQCILWLLLRGCFWLGSIINESIEDELYLKILYWSPCPFEYGAFLLLPLFFAQVLYPREYRAAVRISMTHIHISYIFLILSFPSSRARTFFLHLQR